MGNGLEQEVLSRRQILFGSIAAAALVLPGCGKDDREFVDAVKNAAKKAVEDHQPITHREFYERGFEESVRRTPKAPSGFNGTYRLTEIRREKLGPEGEIKSSSKLWTPPNSRFVVKDDSLSLYTPRKEGGPRELYQVWTTGPPRKEGTQQTREIIGLRTWGRTAGHISWSHIVLQRDSEGNEIKYYFVHRGSSIQRKRESYFGTRK